MQSGPARFETTQWSLVLLAGAGESSAARRGLSALCEAYWYPLYAYVRRQGYARDDAQDLTQAFFARLLEKQDWGQVRKDRGKFRSFLLASIKHFLLNDLEQRRALKRGGGAAPLPIEFDNAESRYTREPEAGHTPESIFDRRWALTVLDRVLSRLKQEAVEAGRGDTFDHLKDCLTGDAPDSYRQLGERAGLTEGAVKVAVHRLRRRYRELLREEIAATVLSDDAVDEEIRYLRRVL